MALHPLAQRFESVAGEYERGRPQYPPAVVGALAAELSVPPGAPVLDLAAGTGKLSRVLLAAGFDLTAVEPLESLREVLTERIGPDRVRDGVAERIPLEDASVDAVTVADAFHWFDHAAALAEIARVLRPGGGLAVLSTVTDWTGATWAHEVGTLVASLRPQHPNFDGPPWSIAARAAGRWSEPREIKITTSQPARPEQIVDYLGSMSWIAALPDDERAPAVERIRILVNGGEMPAELPVHIIIGLTSLTG